MHTETTLPPNLLKSITELEDKVIRINEQISQLVDIVETLVSLAELDQKERNYAQARI